MNISGRLALFSVFILSFASSAQSLYFLKSVEFPSRVYTKTLEDSNPASSINVTSVHDAPTSATVAPPTSRVPAVADPSAASNESSTIPATKPPATVPAPATTPIAASVVNTEDLPAASVLTTCQSSSGKNATFSNRECLLAAKNMADAGSSTAQCGKCVLGLFDAKTKAAYKPDGPIDPVPLKKQVSLLLAQCGTPPSSSAPASRMAKRDTPTSSGGAANVQLLLGYNEGSKQCEGL